MPRRGCSHLQGPSNLTCLVEDFQVFKDPADKRLVTLLMASFSLMGATMRPAMAAIGVCQSPKGRVKCLVKKYSAGTEEVPIEGLPGAL